MYAAWSHVQSPGVRPRFVRNCRVCFHQSFRRALYREQHHATEKESGRAGARPCVSPSSGSEDAIIGNGFVQPAGGISSGPEAHQRGCAAQCAHYERGVVRPLGSVAGVTFRREQTEAACTSELLATRRALRRVKDGDPFRTAYRQTAQDGVTGASAEPAEILIAYVTDGGPGQERPDIVRERLDHHSEWVEARSKGEPERTTGSEAAHRRPVSTGIRMGSAPVIARRCSRRREPIPRRYVKGRLFSAPRPLSAGGDACSTKCLRLYARTTGFL